MVIDCPLVITSKVKLFFRPDKTRKKKWMVQPVFCIVDAGSCSVSHCQGKTMIGLRSDKPTHLVSPSTVLYTPQACSHRPTVSGGRALVTAWIVHIARLMCISVGVKKHIFSVFWESGWGSATCQLDPKLESSVTRLLVWGRIPPVSTTTSKEIWIVQCLDLPWDMIWYVLCLDLLLF